MQVLDDSVAHATSCTTAIATACVADKLGGADTMSRNVSSASGAGVRASSSTPVAERTNRSNRGRRSSSTEPRCGASKSAQTQRAASSARSSPVTSYVAGFAASTSRSRPTSHPPVRGASLPQCLSASQQRSPEHGSNSRIATPNSSTSTSCRTSVVLDASAYRYSLNVGTISRFPASCTDGANQILRATKPSQDVSATIPVPIDPGRASVSSATSSRASSRLSSRYTAEEVAPQRRPVYLALPSDPSAVGPWSNTSSTLLSQSKLGDKHASTSSAAKPHKKSDHSGAPSRNSKIMTSFPFPHPVTPRRRGAGGGEGGSANAAGSGGRMAAVGAAWQRLLTAVFAGPYERQLDREEQEDDRITESIIQGIAWRNGTHRDAASGGRTDYGTISIGSSSKKPASADSQDVDPSDPYGYRRLAGPHLLPSYTTHLVARRRERRRARSRARFQCMALWTIWTVSILLVLIVIVLLFSFVFPDRLRIPNHSDDHVLAPWFPIPAPALLPSITIARIHPS